VVFLPAFSSTGFSLGDKSDTIPTHDGGQEVMSARFIHPAAALQEFREGKIAFMPPQYYLLTTLCDILQGSKNTLHQREKVETLSRGAFGCMVINPQILPDHDNQSHTILTLEGDETRGGPKGRLHRVIVTPEKGGVCIFIQHDQPLHADHPYRSLKRSYSCGILTYFPTMHSAKAPSFEPSSGSSLLFL
jgi:hypothetical protein